MTVPPTHVANLRSYPLIVGDDALMPPEAVEATRVVLVYDLHRGAPWLQRRHDVHLSVVGLAMGRRVI